MKSLLQIPRRSRAKFSDYVQDHRTSTPRLSSPESDEMESYSSQQRIASVEPDEPSETTTFLASERRHTSRSKDRRRMNNLIATTTGNRNVPVGVRIVQRLCIPNVVNRMMWYRVYILVLTFFLYAVYHMSRRPLSVVKNVLHQNCTGLLPPPGTTIDPARNKTWCSWKPFEQDNSQELFAGLDFTYWLAYAVGMFFTGHIAERTNLRNFLSIGMIGAGLWTICFGMAFFWDIHSFSYFVAVQVFGGVFQSTGWPSVVTLVGNWFGKKRLGLIFGIWNSHTSVGNILGALLAGTWVNSQWGYSFIVPGMIICVMGVVSYLFVIVRPEDVGLDPPDHVGDGVTPGAPSIESSEEYGRVNSISSSSSMASKALTDADEDKPISLFRAIRIPGVIEFSLCLFFAKAVSYTFLLWLPRFIQDTSNVQNDVAADLSAIFDAGGIVGGILAGVISDSTGGSATVCGGMFVLAAPSLYLLFLYAGSGIKALIPLLLVSGLLINGPYALITTAVSTDLGTHPSLTGNSKALATVTAIIDGTGSMGAAFGPMAAGLIAAGGWGATFYSLIAAQVVALLCLGRLIYREMKGWIAARRSRRALRAP
ncbi:Glucose-6-phosphate [Hypsibius exemplaris]|uniref:Glucose-6-phosphate n=1 Tax=Hypsibius exemplaris TaxID=2072580 RepID=A0A1W0WJN4_HYPEX|nr:Glucose-6-phosphate [Hypsibius exemplaris]